MPFCDVGHSDFLFDALNNPPPRRQLDRPDAGKRPAPIERRLLAPYQATLPPRRPPRSLRPVPTTSEQTCKRPPLPFFRAKRSRFRHPGAAGSLLRQNGACSHSKPPCRQSSETHRSDKSSSSQSFLGRSIKRKDRGIRQKRRLHDNGSPTADLCARYEHGRVFLDEAGSV